MNAVRTHPDLAANDGPELAVEPARPVSRRTVEQLLAGLHESFVEDDDLDDDLEMVLGAESGLLTMDDVEHLTPRVGRNLAQLVDIAVQRAHGEPGPELAVVISRAHCPGSEQMTRDFVLDRAHLRRLALAILDVLDLLAVEHASPRPAESPGCQRADLPALSRWSA